MLLFKISTAGHSVSYSGWKHNICTYLWPPYVIGQVIYIFILSLVLLLSFFFSTPNLSGRRLDVCHTILEKLNSINDLGIIFDSNLTFKDHMAQKISKAYSILGIIKRNFIHMDESTFILLYKSMVRPHLEYANSVWCPYKQGDIKELEKTSIVAG